MQTSAIQTYNNFSITPETTVPTYHTTRKDNQTTPNTPSYPSTQHTEETLKTLVRLRTQATIQHVQKFTTLNTTQINNKFHITIKGSLMSPTNN